MRFFVFLSMVLIRWVESTSNVLLLAFPDSVTHRRSFYPFALDLAEQNMNVTMASAQLQNYSIEHQSDYFREIHFPVKVDGPLAAIIEDMNKIYSERLFWREKERPRHFLLPWLYSEEICAALTRQNSRSLMSLAQGSSSWDITLVDDTSNGCMFGVAHHLQETKNVPYAMMSTSLLYGPLSLFYGVPFMPSLLPSTVVFREFQSSNFLIRLASSLHLTMELYVSGIAGNERSTSTARSFGPGFSSYPEFVRDADAFFVDYPEAIEFPRPRLHSVIDGGSWCPEAEPKPLPSKLRSFVEDPASKGTVYVAFGTYAVWEHAPEHTLNYFLDAMHHFSDYRFVWSYKGRRPKGLPKNVLTISWVPQLDVLRHPKTKVFFSHGGIKSVREGLCSGRPMVLLPFIVEQPRNAWRLSQKMAGVVLDKTDLSYESIRDALKKVLLNPKYSHNAQRLSVLISDRPIRGDKNRVFWTNFMIRHNGLPRKFFKNSKAAASTLDLICETGLFIVLVLLLIKCVK